MGNTAMTVLGFSIIFAATALGSAVVWFFKRDISQKVNTLFLGFASGIMIAASVWSLLIPSLEGAGNWEKFSFVPAVCGFILGGAFLVLLDHILPHFHSGNGEEEGPRVALGKPAKMFLAVTIHNIPEGLAVGFAFGAAAASGERAAFAAALALAVGLAIQNFPEGAAVALPMKGATGSRAKAFFYGAGSGAVEPVFAVVGYFLAAALTSLQPWFLCGGRHDLRGGGGPHSRFASGGAPASRHVGRDVRLCRDDGARCRPRVRAARKRGERKKFLLVWRCFSRAGVV